METSPYPILLDEALLGEIELLGAVMDAAHDNDLDRLNALLA